MKHRFHPVAEAEFTEAVRYYSSIDPLLGVRFYEEMDNLIREACTWPDRFFMFDPPARRRLSSVFPYGVVYVEKSDAVWILAVMHMKRAPGYWHERIG